MSLLDLQGMESENDANGGAPATGSVVSLTGCNGASGLSALLCASLASVTVCL